MAVPSLFDSQVTVSGSLAKVWLQLSSAQAEIIERSFMIKISASYKTNLHHIKSDVFNFTNVGFILTKEVELHSSSQ
ncbi:hypothetical protein VIBHAR_05063 [Vibrio campbellii ATCC BAA-1116]|uniref:Uncharacterized protein n=1 Tax=Vibrio campbellii (strain ATCC BAA-1116) TaxID=2902295 RepID=A7N368_VIBC1|nr:hypothetical protein VIBHAR_05063 [Vibrio campbellii ATCC BAA-1116]